MTADQSAADGSAGSELARLSGSAGDESARLGCCLTRSDPVGKPRAAARAKQLKALSVQRPAFAGPAVRSAGSGERCAGGGPGSGLPTATVARFGSGAG